MRTPWRELGDVFGRLRSVCWLRWAFLLIFILHQSSAPTICFFWRCHRSLDCKSQVHIRASSPCVCSYLPRASQNFCGAKANELSHFKKASWLAKFSDQDTTKIFFKVVITFMQRSCSNFGLDRESYEQFEKPALRKKKWTFAMNWANEIDERIILVL